MWRVSKVVDLYKRTCLWLYAFLCVCEVLLRASVMVSVGVRRGVHLCGAPYCRLVWCWAVPAFMAPCMRLARCMAAVLVVFASVCGIEIPVF
jgi:hypothetical protein